MTRVVISAEAQDDLIAAFEFYEERREGLGQRFRDHVDLAMGRIQAAPERYPLVYRDLRRRLVERFPYAILYRSFPGLIYIVAVMHAKRSPRRWKRRS